MSTYSEKIASKLNDLLARTYDAEKGFQNAAENIDSVKLKEYFSHKAAERKTFGHALKEEIKSYNQDVDKGGSIEGSVHRAWMDLKNTFTPDNEEAMLEEVITGENKAIDDYNDIINDTELPSSTKQLLVTQVSKIQDSLSTAKKLEDVY